MTSTSVYVHPREKFEQGHRLGTVVIDGLQIAFMGSTSSPLSTLIGVPEQMEELRDELQRQIEAIRESQKPADPPPPAPADFYPTSPEPDSVVVTIPPVEESDVPF